MSNAKTFAMSFDNAAETGGPLQYSQISNVAMRKKNASPTPVASAYGNQLGL